MTVGRLKLTSAIAWALCWFGLWLEIFRWHHVTRSLRLNPPPVPPGSGIHARPGGFLIAILTGSVIAPLTFMTAAVVDRARGGRDTDGGQARPR
jgi:tellurite resistance protein TehA-like permease